MTDPIAAAFAAVNRDTLPPTKAFMALGRELYRAGLWGFVWRLNHNNTSDIPPVKAALNLVLSPTRHYLLEAEEPPESSARKRGMADTEPYLKRCAAYIRENRQWPNVRRELAKIAAAVKSELAPQAKAIRKRQLPPLTDNEATVLDLIDAHPEGITGKEIENKTGIKQASLTSHIIPNLKCRGVRNRQKVGYFRLSPGDKSAAQ